MVVFEGKDSDDLASQLTDEQHAKIDGFIKQFSDNPPAMDDPDLQKDFKAVATALKEDPAVLEQLKGRWLPAFKKKLKELQAAKKYISTAFFEVYDKIGTLTEFEGYKEWQGNWSELQKEYEVRKNSSRDLAVKITSTLSTINYQLAQRYKEDGYLEHFIEVATKERADIDAEKAKFDELKKKLLDFKVGFDEWTTQTTDAQVEVVNAINANISAITRDLQNLEMHKKNLLDALLGLGIATPAVALVLGILTCGVGALIVGLVGAVAFAGVGFAIIGVAATIENKTSQLKKAQAQRDKLVKQLHEMKALEADVDKFVNVHISGDSTPENPGIVAELDAFKGTWDSIASVLGEVKTHVESGEADDWRFSDINQVIDEFGELIQMLDLFKFELEADD